MVLRLNKKQRVALSLLFEESSKTVCKECMGCCCSGCARNNAHFYEDTKPFERAKAAAKFDKEKGFLTSEGCALPRKLRSNVCLSYCCSKFGQAFNELVDEITHPGRFERGLKYEEEERRLRKLALPKLVQQIKRDYAQVRINEDYAKRKEA